MCLRWRLPVENEDPFEGTTRQFATNAALEFTSPEWDSISQEAKDYRTKPAATATEVPAAAAVLLVVIKNPSSSGDGPLFFRPTNYEFSINLIKTNTTVSTCLCTSTTMS